MALELATHRDVPKKWCTIMFMGKHARVCTPNVDLTHINRHLMLCVCVRPFVCTRLIPK